MLDMRSYRGPNGAARHDESYGPDTHVLGPTQLAWLKHELKNSQATWKILAADLPLGLISYEGIAQGNGGACGRELEIADLLSFIRRAGIHNTVWITADVHYTAAHYYDPNRAVFQDFAPFWEFVSGPLHAGTWTPSDLDNTFGPQLMYQKACSKEQGENLAPCFGLQFFGHVAIDGVSEIMTVTLKDVNDIALWATTLAPHVEGA
jgi:alkaline phosphatase D